MSNQSLHRYLKIITELAKMYYKRFHKKLATNPNHLITSMANNFILDQPARKMKKKMESRFITINQGKKNLD